MSAIDTLNNRVFVIVRYLLLAILGITMFEVISRFAFNRPTIWAHETIALMFGVYLILGGGYVLFCGKHIRIDVFWSRLSPRKQAIADLATCGFAFLFLSMLLWESGEAAWESIQLAQTSVSPFSPPLYPSKICLAIGVLLILLQLIVKTIRDLRQAITGGESA